MKPGRILIANASRARLLPREAGCPAVLSDSFGHPQSRTMGSELRVDGPGQEKADRSFGGAAYQPRRDPKDKRHPRVACELANEPDLTSVGPAELDQRGAHESAHRVCRP